MSRIGNKPVELPSGVQVDIKNQKVIVKGSLGENTIDIIGGLKVEVEGTVLKVVNPNTEIKQEGAYHGLIRSLIFNAVYGVSTGFVKELEIQGVGYRAQQKGTSINFQLGYSNDVLFDTLDGVKIEVLEPTKIKVSGYDKQMVGQVSANIRSLRPPEPYKGKGIRYKGELVRKKAGKTGK